MAYDTRLQRRVVIKIIALPYPQSPNEQLPNEAILMARLQHQRVVLIYDIICIGSHVALIMEYVEGSDLEALILRQRITLRELLIVTIDICTALSVCYTQGIVHGDIKPANILVDINGRAKLSDFGIARVVGEACSTDEAGTMGVISPEQYKGARIDSRSDLFSLGCVLYRALSGGYPFFRRRLLSPSLLLETNAKPLSALLFNGKSIPAELVDLISELLKKNPGRRLKIHFKSIAC